MRLQRIPHDATQYRNNPVELLNISNRNRIGSDYAVTANTKLFITGTGENNSTNIVDATGKTVTRYGDTKISTAQSIIGGSSIYFDGTGDYLSVAASSDFYFDTGDFTIDFWFRYASVAEAVLISQYSAGWKFYIDVVSSSRFDVAFANGSISITSGVTLSNGVWYHLTAVKSGTTATIYVDGVSKGSFTVASSIGLSTAPIIIGVAASDLSDSPLNGYLSHIRITKGQALWTANFTPPSKISDYMNYNNYIGA